MDRDLFLIAGSGSGSDSFRLGSDSVSGSGSDSVVLKRLVGGFSFELVFQVLVGKSFVLEAARKYFCSVR